MVIIGVDQSLSNSALYKHICLENKKIYRWPGKYDYKHQHKAIIEAAMVSTPEGFTDIIPMSSGPYMPVKQTNLRKPLRKFSETLDVKPTSSVCHLCAAKPKRNANRAVSMLWYSIPK